MKKHVNQTYLNLYIYNCKLARKTFLNTNFTYKFFYVDTF